MISDTDLGSGDAQRDGMPFVVTYIDAAQGAARCLPNTRFAHSLATILWSQRRHRGWSEIGFCLVLRTVPGSVGFWIVSRLRLSASNSY